MNLEQAEAQLIEINSAQDGWELALDSWIENLTEDQIEPLMPAMFRFFEANPDEHIWTLIHTIETIDTRYYKYLLYNSLETQPSVTVCSMVNRILNTKLHIKERIGFMALLETVFEHPLASAMVLESAEGFIEYQLNNPRE